jgi:hypothetical protein
MNRRAFFTLRVHISLIAALFLATGTDALASHYYRKCGQADDIAAECGRFDQQCMKKERSIAACDLLFDYGYLLPGNQIGACYAKATNNRCDGSLDGSKMQVCTDWVEAHPKPRRKRK